ncbi:KN motif and ankyrin repeat domain-containing protein 2 kank isoform X2 [Rhodnius prolixus]|uniref:KN motif and ankyrin repeat domain-containing protein 2 kank isoform X2 n=1 Tax=Rhodnius prolixus TaxID=13249 RepID=UPI003D18D485
MATSIARPYHTLGHHQLAKNPGRRKCRCCPYGYHIDVDFVRYCETIADSQVLSDLPVRKSRWNVRKRRASKETLLGIANATQLSEDISKASQDVGDDLQKAVMDFEQVLTSTTVGRSTTLPRRKEFLPKFENHEKLINTINKNLNNHNVSTKYISAPIEEVILHVDDLECPGMNNSIRKQMAASLGRMKELEEQVKLIPNLQAHISNLENENQKLNLMLKDKIETLNQLQYKKKCIDATTSTNCLNYHTRNIGVSCTIMTRDIGINSSVKMATSATETIRLASLSEKLETAGQSRPCLISLENILGNGSKSNLKHVSTTTESSKVTKDATTETDINSKKLFTEDEVAKRVQKIENNFENRRRSNRKNIALLTDLKLDQIYTQEDLNRSLAKANQAIIAKKALTVEKCEQAVFLPETKENLTQTKCIVKIDASTLSRVSAKDGWNQMSKLTKDIGISNHTINDPCQNCGIKKRVNIGIQHDGVSGELEQLARWQTTDTYDLIKTKEQAVNTTKRKLVNTAVDACSLYCQKCANEIDSKVPEKTIASSTSSRKLPETKIARPSYLPVPLKSSPVKSRTPSKNLNGLRNEDYLSDSGSDDAQNDDIVQRFDDSFSTFHPIQSKSYKKEPSNEMKGALKVLNDALQKYSSDNFPNHMNNAINVVQQEWFKVSSVAEANPLDVEDYLDCFEDISSTLLEYIVNMTDVTGNTAMHYAVSNGNFDVVSILLDSKVCNINKMNFAGYTCIMLVALTKVKSETDRQVVRRLFHMADVNIRAKQHGQTALMLAVSHGRIDTVELLLESGADINIQDEDGSTALMCAAEHGYIDIVKLLLTQPDCDLSLTDYDGSTALAIAMDAGNRDIGVLLYAQEHFTRMSSPYSVNKVHRRAKSATPTLRHSATPPLQSPQQSHHGGDAI